MTGEDCRLFLGDETIDSTHKILIIDPSDALKEKTGLLTAKGYSVDLYRDPVKALDRLDASEQASYSLVITVYTSPGMSGDELLGNIKTISPDTQRLLIADHRDLERFVHGVNSASIHACMAFPFSDEDLLRQVKLKCHDYASARKLKSLENTIQRQNDQLFAMAENFKKKKALYEIQSEKKKREIRILASRLTSSFGPAGETGNAGLKDLLIRQNVSLNPKRFQEAFFRIQEQINQILEISFAKHDRVFDLADNPVDEPQSPEDRRKAKAFMSILLNLIHHKQAESEKVSEVLKKRNFSEQFDLTFSQDGIGASLSLQSAPGASVSLFQVKRFLEKNRVVYGLAEDAVIEDWLYDEDKRKSPLAVARGKSSVQPTNGRVKYYFAVEFLHAGKVSSDGSIDFRDRGEIPIVPEDMVLASKTFPEPGAFGINVHGERILVDEPYDPLFSAGPGTRLSEDETKIYSTESGQPHRDIMGVVSVCPEHYINGDIDYKTGNIEFEGNVIVSGTVRQGFKVKCTSLTAKEINGAEIDVDGDLNVSLGIVDTDLVNVKGTVQAKFIRNSRICAFGDLRIQKEIIDSRVYLSGACLNPGGLIVNSTISAKMGIVGGTIGRKTSAPSTLIVGIDEPAKQLMEKIDSRLAMNQTQMEELKARAADLEDENQDLHARITQKAHVQDRAQLDIKRIKQNRFAPGKVKGRAGNDKRIAGLVQTAKKAENKINQGFRRQDEISLALAEVQLTVKELEELNKSCIAEKKAILALSSGTEPLQEVKVLRYVESKTRILTERVSKTLGQSQYRCCIRQVCNLSRGRELYEIDIDRC